MINFIRPEKDMPEESKTAVPCDECPFVHPAKSNRSNRDLDRLAKPEFRCTKNVEKRATIVRDVHGNYMDSHKYIRVGDDLPCVGMEYYLKNNGQRWRRPGK